MIFFVRCLAEPSIVVSAASQQQIKATSQRVVNDLLEPLLLTETLSEALREAGADRTSLPTDMARGSGLCRFTEPGGAVSIASTGREECPRGAK